ncbi:hypothetical protein RG47T_1339 [Mucilaginibacter polytrichastri]|uniref:Uncharacterized protein n=1 Tax=Mucilaginibacter polytrichastri TaxID=1302689 RepID=A0A1Q5ZVY0_9SPHI|nr:hypothetical protein RG47T_1339 [Mucilaginibacter polytrichastri]
MIRSVNNSLSGVSTGKEWRYDDGAKPHQSCHVRPGETDA